MLGWGLAAGLALAALGAGLLYVWGDRLLTAYVESDAFRAMLSRETSKALKVQGTFAPIERDGWIARTPGFRSTGLPGQVITRLDAEQAEGVFDPAGVLQGLWKFDRITIERAVLGLQNPVISDQTPPPKPPKPWYAVFLPTRFYPEVVEARSVHLEWKFRGEEASIDPIHLFVTPAGMDWEFTGTGGRLDMALAPKMWLKEISVHMSKPYFTVQSATFVADQPDDPAYVTFHAKMGLLPRDRSLRAHVTAREVPIGQALPESLRPYISARGNGDIEWFSNPAEKDGSRASGDLRLTQARIQDLPLLTELVKVHANPALTAFDFQQASLSFVWDGRVFATDNLRLRSEGYFALKASLRVPQDLDLTARLDLEDFQLEPWLQGIDGTVTGWLDWKGDPTRLDACTATGELDLAGTTLENPPLLAAVTRRYGIGNLRHVTLSEAYLKLGLADGVAAIPAFRFRTLVDSELSGSAAYNLKTNHADVTVRVSNIQLARWLPAQYQKVFLPGRLNGRVHYTGSLRDAADGQAEGDIDLLKSGIPNNRFLNLLARFYDDPRLFTLDLSRARLHYAWRRDTLHLSRIDVGAAKVFRITGWARISPEKRLAGTLNLGVAPEFLRFLPDDGRQVFATKKDGYYWTPVRLSGTVEKPGQDLTGRLRSNILSSPCATLRLAFKLLSWWVGDLLDTVPPPYHGRPT